MNKARKTLTMCLCFMLVAITVFASTFMNTQQAVAESYTANINGSGYLNRTTTQKGNGIYEVVNTFYASEEKKPLKAVIIVDVSTSCWPKYVYNNACAFVDELKSTAPSSLVSIVVVGKQHYANTFGNYNEGLSQFSVDKWKTATADLSSSDFVKASDYTALYNGTQKYMGNEIQKYCWTSNWYYVSAQSTELKTILNNVLNEASTDGATSPLDIGFVAARYQFDHNSKVVTNDHNVSYYYYDNWEQLKNNYVNLTITFSDFKATWGNNDDDNQKREAVAMARMLENKCKCTMWSVHTNCARRWASLVGKWACSFPNAFVCAKLCSTGGDKWTGQTWVDGAQTYGVELVGDTTDNLPFYNYVDDSNATNLTATIKSVLATKGLYNSAFSDNTIFKETVDNDYFKVLTAADGYAPTIKAQRRTKDTLSSTVTDISSSLTNSISISTSGNVTTLVSGTMAAESNSVGASKTGLQYTLTYYIQKKGLLLTEPKTVKLIQSESFAWTSTLANANYHIVEEIGSPDVTFDATTYAVKYYTVGGSEVRSQVKKYNVPLTITSEEPTLTGYTFAGWSINGPVNANPGSIDYRKGDKYLEECDITLNAVWKAEVTYNANGGTSSDISFPYVNTLYRSGHTTSRATSTGSTATMFNSLAYAYNATSVLTKNGCAFKCWNTEADGSGTSINAGEEFTLKNMTLYAIYEDKTFVINYDGNGATSGETPSTTHQVGKTSYIASNKFTKSYTASFIARGGCIYNGYDTNCIGVDKSASYTFAGWQTPNNNIVREQASISSISELNPTTNGQVYTFKATWTPTSITVPIAYKKGANCFYWEDADTGEQVEVDSKYTPTDNNFFFPVWETKSFVINFDKNGGIGTMSPLTCSYYNDDNTESSDTIPTNMFIKAGYTFVGWDLTNEDGDTVRILNGATANSVYNAYFEKMATEAEATDDIEFTLKAVWSAANYNIKYCSDNGVSYSDVTVVAPYNDNYTLTDVHTLGFNGNNNTVRYNVKDNYTVNGTSVSSLSTTGSGDSKFYSVNYERTFSYWSFNSQTIANKAVVNNLVPAGQTAQLTAVWSTSAAFTVPTVSVPGYDFIGWSTTQGKTTLASGDYVTGQSYSLNSSSLTLYPILNPQMVDVKANLYEMDTSGQYKKTETKTWSAQVGSTISNPFTDMASAGQYFTNTTPTGFASVCTSTTVTSTGATLNCYLARKKFNVSFEGYMTSYIEADDVSCSDESYDYRYEFVNQTGVNGQDQDGSYEMYLYYEQEIDISKIVPVAANDSVWNFKEWSFYDSENIISNKVAYSATELCINDSYRYQEGNKYHLSAGTIFKQPADNVVFDAVYQKDITCTATYIDNSYVIERDSSSDIIKQFNTTIPVIVTYDGASPNCTITGTGESELSISVTSITPSGVSNIAANKQKLTLNNGFTFKGWSNSETSATVVNTIKCQNNIDKVNLFALYNGTATVRYRIAQNLLDTLNISNGTYHTLGTPNSYQVVASDSGNIVIAANDKTGYSVVQGFNYTRLDLGFSSLGYKTIGQVYSAFFTSTTTSDTTAINTNAGKRTGYYKDGSLYWHSGDEETITIYGDTIVDVDFSAINYSINYKDNKENYPTSNIVTKTQSVQHNGENSSETTVLSSVTLDEINNNSNVLIGWSPDKTLTSSSVLLAPQNLSYNTLLTLINDKYNDGATITLYPHYLTVELTSDSSVITPNSTMSYTAVYTVPNYPVDTQLSNFTFTDEDSATKGTILTDVSNTITLNNTNRTFEVDITESFGAVEKQQDFTRYLNCDVKTVETETVAAKTSIELTSNYYNVYYYDGSTLLFTDSTNYVPGSEFIIDSRIPSGGTYKYFTGWTIPSSSLANITVDEETNTSYIFGDIVLYSEWTSTNFYTSSSANSAVTTELMPGSEYYYIININNTKPSNNEKYKIVIPNGASWNASNVTLKLNGTTTVQASSSSANSCVQKTENGIKILEIQLSAEWQNTGISKMSIVVPMKVDSKPSTSALKTVIYEEKQYDDETVKVIYGSNYYDMRNATNATNIETSGLNFASNSLLDSIAHNDTLKEFFTITYQNGDATGGTLPVDNNIYYANDTATISSTQMSKTGYECLGWVDTNGNAYSFGQGVLFYSKSDTEAPDDAVQSSLTLEPLFIKLTWTASTPTSGQIRTYENVTYTAEVETTTTVKNISLKAGSPTGLTHVSTSFAYSSEETEYPYSTSSTAVSEGSALTRTITMKANNDVTSGTVINNSVTLTIGNGISTSKTVAITYGEGYKVTYVVNGCGNITAPVDNTIYSPGDTVTIMSPTSTDSIYHFYCWEDSYTMQWAAGDELTITEDITLVANCIYLKKQSVVSGGAVEIGSTITYTISLCSTSENYFTVENLVIEDVIPDGTSLISVTMNDDNGTPTPVSGKLTWNYSCECIGNVASFIVQVGSTYNDGTAFSTGSTFTNTASGSYTDENGVDVTFVTNTVTDTFSQYKVQYIIPETDEKTSSNKEVYYCTNGSLHPIQCISTHRTINGYKVDNNYNWTDGTTLYAVGQNITVTQNIDLYPVYICSSIVSATSSDSALKFEPLDTTATIVLKITNTSTIATQYTTQSSLATYLNIEHVYTSTTNTEGSYTELTTTDSTYSFTSTSNTVYVKFVGVFNNVSYGQQFTGNSFVYYKNGLGSDKIVPQVGNVNINVNPKVTFYYSATGSNGYRICDRNQTNTNYSSNPDTILKAYSYSYRSSLLSSIKSVTFVHIPYGTEFKIPNTVVAGGAVTLTNALSGSSGRYITLSDIASGTIRGICFDAGTTSVSTRKNIQNYMNEDGNFYYTLNGTVSPFYIYQQYYYYTNDSKYISGWDSDGAGTLSGTYGTTTYISSRKKVGTFKYEYTWSTSTAAFTLSASVRKIQGQAGTADYKSFSSSLNVSNSLNTISSISKNMRLFAVYDTCSCDVYTGYNSTNGLTNAIPEAQVTFAYKAPITTTGRFSQTKIAYTEMTIPKTIDVTSSLSNFTEIVSGGTYDIYCSNGLSTYNDTAHIYGIVNNKATNGQTSRSSSVRRSMTSAMLEATVVVTYYDTNGEELCSEEITIRPTGTKFLPAYSSVAYLNDSDDVIGEDVPRVYFLPNKGISVKNNDISEYNSETNSYEITGQLFSKANSKFVAWEDRAEQETYYLIDYYRIFYTEEEITQLEGYTDTTYEDGVQYGFYDENGAPTQITCNKLYKKGTADILASTASDYQTFDLYPVFETSAELPETGSTQLISLGILISALCAGYVLLKKREKSA